MTRATATLLGAGVAGLLLWVATQIGDRTTGGYWAVYGIVAAAGLTIALAQLVGGWTKWGWPRLSGSVFLLGFLPALIVGGWIVLGHQPHPNWFRNHVLTWSHDIGVRGLVRDLGEYAAVIAFGLGLLFGMTFDTSGPRRVVAPAPTVVDETTIAPGTPSDGVPADEPVARERGGFLGRSRRVRTPAG